MGGAQSIFTCAYDEPFQIPTEFSAELALRTQQIIAYESGVARTVDPLGGSYYVEWLTGKMDEKIVELMDEVRSYGGAVKAIEDGWLQMKVARRAHRRKREIDSGDFPMVGLNCFQRVDQPQAPGEVFQLDPGGSARVLQKYQAVRDRRDDAAAVRTLDALEKAAAKDGENLMPYLVDCCHAYATIGEMVQRLKRQWGEFQEPVRL
jgi:methylmalonyl-CoA mutase N-terminal domain/subunit